MNAIEKGLFSLLAVATLTGCASVPTLNVAASPGVSAKSLPGQSLPVATPSTAPTKQLDRSNTETVTIYSADAECESLIPQQVEVPQGNTLDATVGEIINRWNNSDFRLAGYRVSVDAQTGLATVDFRVVPNSERVMISLSSCERYALFGSISETLTSNPQWNISQVRFTDRGEEITF